MFTVHPVGLCSLTLVQFAKKRDLSAHEPRSPVALGVVVASSIFHERPTHGSVGTAAASLWTAHLILDSLAIQTHGVHGRHVEFGAEPLLPADDAARVQENGRKCACRVFLDSSAGVVGRERRLDPTEGALDNLEIWTAG